MSLREQLPYRLGVGIMLLDAGNRVFVGQRFDSHVEAWQMPQGGIDEGEDPYRAALRELREETGVRPALVSEVAATAGWLCYDLPDHLLGQVWQGRYRGQRQKWFALRFRGTDADVDLMADAHAEFRDWRWVAIDDLHQLIVPFKRQLYAAVIGELRPQLGGA